MEGIKALLSFQGDNSQRDADWFQSAMRYGQDTQFSIQALTNVMGNDEEDGIEIIVSEPVMPHRKVTIFIPTRDNKPIQVSETKLAREAIQITHN